MAACVHCSPLRNQFGSLAERFLDYSSDVLSTGIASVLPDPMSTYYLYKTPVCFDSYDPWDGVHNSSNIYTGFILFGRG